MTTKDPNAIVRRIRSSVVTLPERSGSHTVRWVRPCPGRQGPGPPPVLGWDSTQDRGGGPLVASTTRVHETRARERHPVENIIIRRM